jgi:hypothetical protein
MKSSRPHLAINMLASSLLLSMPCALAAQSSLVIGSRNDSTIVPFGSSKAGQAYFTSGQYQLIYAANEFPSALWITRIAFAQDISNAGTDTYNFSLGLGTTWRTPDSPGNTLETNFTILFSGSLSPVFTPATDDFDFAINLSSPFYYDPAQANLLLNITMVSATATNSMFALDAASSSMGQLWKWGIAAVDAWPNSGLVTEFTVVPEPSTLALAGLGGLCLLARVARWRRLESGRSP